MNIALIGYGKMGQIIDKIATQRGHNIVVRLNETPTAENLAGIDVAIEFSQPEVAFENIKICLENKIPVICPTNQLFRNNWLVGQKARNRANR